MREQTKVPPLPQPLCPHRFEPVLRFLGQGVAKNYAEAYKWHLLAGAQGDEDAKKNIELIERKLTPAQRAEGQKRAREFKPVKAAP